VIRMTKADLLGLEYDDADFLEYVLESFLEDHKAALEFHVGTRKRIAYARSVLRELKKFTGDPERCGVMGPEGKESRLQCTRMSHPDTVHRALDMQPMKIVRWRGDKSDEFAKSLIESGLVEMG
jgi:hypothetical protein